MSLSSLTSRAKVFPLPLLLVGLLCVSQPLLATNLDPLQEGQQAFNKGDYKTAFHAWLKLAARGNPQAQVFVGLSHSNGWGVKKNPKEAAVWYEMAAKKGNASGQFLLGVHLIKSLNDKEHHNGVEWLIKAAKNGDTDAVQLLEKANKNNWFEVSDQVLNKLKSAHSKSNNKPQTLSMRTDAATR